MDEDQEVEAMIKMNFGWKYFESISPSKFSKLYRVFMSFHLAVTSD